MSISWLGSWLWVPEMKLAFQPKRVEGEDLALVYIMRGNFDGEIKDVEVKFADLPEAIQNALRGING